MSNKIDDINKKIKETIKMFERKCIELESDFTKNNKLILQDLRDLLLKYKITYKNLSLV